MSRILRPQFGIRALLLLITIAATGILIWQSIPTHGKPILEGQITDSIGNPIPDVEIVLHSGWATRFPGQRAMTNRNGRFVFAPLETGSILFDENQQFNSLVVGIRIDCPGYRAVDGNEWWDVHVPMIQNRRHTWNLKLTKRDSDELQPAD